MSEPMAGDWESWILLGDYEYVSKQEAEARLAEAEATIKRQGIWLRLNTTGQERTEREKILADSIVLCEKEWAEAEAEIIRLKSIAPYVEASGHYCDGMTEAWTDAQIAIGDKDEAEEDAERLYNLLCEIRASSRVALKWGFEDTSGALAAHEQRIRGRLE